MSYTLYYHIYSAEEAEQLLKVNKANYASFLCARDWEKFQKIKDDTYRCEFLLIRLLFQRIIELHKLPWLVSDLKYSDKGKPYIENNAGWSFSFAHTNNLVAIIIAKDQVGLDTECRQQKIRSISSFLTPLEVEQIAESDEHFWDVWTKKESAVKLEGSTLARFRRYCTIENPSGYFYSTLTIDRWKFCVSSKNRVQRLETTEIKKIPFL